MVIEKMKKRSDIEFQEMSYVHWLDFFTEGTMTEGTMTEGTMTGILRPSSIAGRTGRGTIRQRK